MRIQRINLNDPETVDIAVVNVSGASITLGLPVSFCTTANSADGVNVVQPAAANLATFAGIALSTIPNLGNGLVRAYGICNSTAIFATGASATVGIGTAMGPGVAGSLGVNSLGLTNGFGPVIALETVTATMNSAGGGYVKTFVRAL
jgi:hypothetical protein